MADLTSKIKLLIQTLSDANLSNDDKEKFIADLADFIKNEKGTNYLGHYPITEADWGDNSLFKKFNKLIDLDNAQGKSSPIEAESLSYIEHLLSLSGDNAKLWNESLRLMINLYKDKIDNKDSNIIIATKKVGSTSTQHEFAIQDILKANAGWSFINLWVKPYENIDNSNYDTVRGNDKINQVLESHKNMLFTHTLLDENDNNSKNQVLGYIRLIMPKYTRRVEVEDLNRNFWVIGQVLTAVCAYLFDDESPISKMFKHLMNETTLLWENVLYIWAALAALSEKDYVPYDQDHIRCEVVYLPNDSLNHEMKFDNFDISHTASIGWTEIKERLSYLIDMYPKKHLCIAPIIRYKNYAKNYYEGEKYPGILIYDRNEDEWVKTIQFEGNSTDFGRIGDSGVCNILEISKITDSNNHAPNAARDINTKTIYISNKYYNEDIEESSSYEYYCAIRTKPSLICGYVNNDFKPGFTVKIYDAIYDAIRNNTPLLGDFGLLFYNDSEDAEYNFLWLKGSLRNPIEVSRSYEIISGKAYYLGEVLSAHKFNTKIDNWKVTEVTKHTISGTDSATLVKIGSFMSDTVNSSPYQGYQYNYVGLMTDNSGRLTKTNANYTVYYSSGSANTSLDFGNNYFYWHKKWNNSLDTQYVFSNVYEDKVSSFDNDNFEAKLRALLINLVGNETAIKNFIFTIGAKWVWPGHPGNIRLYWSYANLAYFCLAFKAIEGTEVPDTFSKYTYGQNTYYYRYVLLDIGDVAYGTNEGWPSDFTNNGYGTWRTPRLLINLGSDKVYYYVTVKKDSGLTSGFYSANPVSIGTTYTDQELKNKLKNIDIEDLIGSNFSAWIAFHDEYAGFDRLCFKISLDLDNKSVSISNPYYHANSSSTWIEVPSQYTPKIYRYLNNTPIVWSKSKIDSNYLNTYTIPTIS